MAEGQICQDQLTLTTIAHMRSTSETGSIEIMNLTILIRVLTSFIPVIPTPNPIITTHPRGTTALLPEPGKSEA